MASTASKGSLHFTRVELLPGFPSYTLLFTCFSFFFAFVVYIFLVRNCKRKVQGPLGPRHWIWGFLQLHICLLLYVLKGVILLSKGHAYAEKPIAFRSTRKKKSHYKIFVHSGAVPVTCFSYALLSLWSSCRFCYILLHLFLRSESLSERQGDVIFSSPLIIYWCH